MKKNTDFILTAILEIYPEKTPDVSVLTNLFAAGLDLLYLRSNAVTGIAWGKILNDLGSAFKERIIVPAFAGESVSTCQSIIHLKEKERKGLRPETLLPNQVYSTSVHHLPDMLDLPPCFRYVFYSPVFESISKPGYGPQYDLLAVKRTLEKLKLHNEELPIVIGLGGVKADNIKQVRETGLNGAALMGALWQAADPVQVFKEIKQALEISQL
jgi:thiamine-phosphate pyrophosphorylase